MATDTNKDRLLIHITPEYQEKIKKLRKISEIEGRSISFLARIGLDMFIKKYEDEKGVVEVGSEG